MTIIPHKEVEKARAYKAQQEKMNREMQRNIKHQQQQDSKRRSHDLHRAMYDSMDKQERSEWFGRMQS